MRQKFSLRIGDHLQAADSKRFYNEQVFTEIAPRYDFITRGLSFWRDAAWKRTLIQWLPGLTAPLCLDLACGTGDISGLLAEKYTDGTIVGLDITESMLQLARARHTQPSLSFRQGDMAALPYADESADIITGGYALRNAPDLGVTLHEIQRVLKPGGVAAFLDFSKPDGAFAQRVEYAVLKGWTGLWGLALHGNHEVYSYIAESLALYPSRSELVRRFAAHGLVVQRSQLNFFGITAIIMVQKPHG
jgi:demethylmenaquinone methyltransferase/2-methoxy-6-polyprenyl-1,4-benzoquinol methylase